MSTQVAVAQDKGGLLEQVLIQGDLSKLNPEQRGSYYMKVCDSVGLNPLTKPFEYITLNGKLTLYALRGCTDQLRSLHKVSVEELNEVEKEGVFIVTAKVRNADGRTDMAKGAVNISGLKGEALANALMKAETKAKRRATLSICGLGMLDETEVETIPNAQVEAKSLFKTSAQLKKWTESVIEAFEAAEKIEELNEAAKLNKPKFDELTANGNEYDVLAVEELRKRYLQIRVRLEAKQTSDELDDNFRSATEELQVDLEDTIASEAAEVTNLYNTQAMLELPQKTQSDLKVKHKQAMEILRANPDGKLDVLRSLDSIGFNAALSSAGMGALKREMAEA